VATWEKVMCVTLFEGWAKQLASINLDDKHNGLLIPVNNIEEILIHLDNG
jgi:hypothetical protein